MLQATATINASFGLKQKTKVNIAKHFHESRTIRKAFGENGGFPLLKYQETLKMPNDVAMKFGKNHILHWRHHPSLF